MMKMIEIENISQSQPYSIFHFYYQEALRYRSNGLDAMLVASMDTKKNEVDARYVNLKCIDDESWVFFTNYNSPKSKQFSLHNQIAIVFYWDCINVQIRLKAKIKQTSLRYNQKYFASRSIKKNALSISSSQSMPIKSYEDVKDNYNKSLKFDNLRKCPEFWGGYSFTPYYFEFWEGHSSRLNKRDVYEKNDNSWKHLILQP
jgi:pyridoxamine 5'-phosphate oxidase